MNIVDLRNLKEIKNKPIESLEDIPASNASRSDAGWQAGPPHYEVVSGEEKNAKEEEITHINPQRRQLLKFILAGSGAFVLGLLAKSAGFSGLFSKSENKSGGSQTSSGLESGSQKETDFKNWRVIEKNNQVTFIDRKTNEEVLILD